jgi:FAD/FMN-containing dehydrogenase
MKMDAKDRNNWYGDIQCHDGKVVVAKTEQDLVHCLRNEAGCPSPVRPCGSRHSITPCMAASSVQGGWGTLVDLSGMDGELRIDKTAMTVTVGAGRRLFDVARALQKEGLQLHVNPEIGSLTMGSAACVATKDSSFPGEVGQIGSYAVSMRVALADGSVRTFDETDPDFPALRSSYGLFGIVLSATFQVTPCEAISIQHEEIAPEEFEAASQRWLEQGSAVFLYLFPYAKRIVAELRRKTGAGAVDESSRMALRNFFWSKAVPRVARFGVKLPDGVSRETVLRSEDHLVRRYLNDLLQVDQFNAADQVIDFEDAAKFTFSMWGFPAREFARIVPEYFALCREQRRAIDFRSAMPDASYHIGQDAKSLLSYSHDGPVWTLDPVSTGTEPGWNEFLRVFNDRCSSWGGVPLFNQTPWLERRHVERAFGDRLVRFERARRRFDPHNRLLNRYFSELLPTQV